MPPDFAKTVAELRARGWSVAVHNDYRLAGEHHTFWLWTHPNGTWIKGEGTSDNAALAQCLTAAERAPAVPDVGEIGELIARLNAPAYWMSGSEDGHDGDNDSPREAATALASQAERIATLTAERDEAREIADCAAEQIIVIRQSHEHKEQQRLLALNNELLELAYAHDPFDPKKRGELYKDLWVAALELGCDDMKEATAALAAAREENARLSEQLALQRACRRRDRRDEGRGP